MNDTRAQHLYIFFRSYHVNMYEHMLRGGDIIFLSGMIYRVNRVDYSGKFRFSQTRLHHRRLELCKLEA